jgi:hypothetical protein
VKNRAYFSSTQQQWRNRRVIINIDINSGPRAGAGHLSFLPPVFSRQAQLSLPPGISSLWDRSRARIDVDRALYHAPSRVSGHGGHGFSKRFTC